MQWHAEFRGSHSHLIVGEKRQVTGENAPAAGSSTYSLKASCCLSVCIGTDIKKNKVIHPAIIKQYCIWKPGRRTHGFLNINLSLFFHPCSMRTRVYVGAHAYVCEQKPAVDTFLDHSPAYLRQGLLLTPGLINSAILPGQQVPEICVSQPLGHARSCLAFMWVLGIKHRSSNTGPHASVTGTLPTESFPEPDS